MNIGEKNYYPIWCNYQPTLGAHAFAIKQSEN